MPKKITLLFVLSVLVLQACASLPRINDTRPNFLIILTDDQRYDTMQYMPKTQSLIFDQGGDFPARLHHNTIMLSQPRQYPDWHVRPQQ